MAMATYSFVSPLADFRLHFCAVQSVAHGSRFVDRYLVKQEKINKNI